VAFEALRRLSPKPLARAPDQPNRIFEGQLVAYAVHPDRSEPYAIVDTGAKLRAIPTSDCQLEAGRTVRARSYTRQTAGAPERRRLLTWQLDDLEQLRDRSRSR